MRKITQLTYDRHVEEAFNDLAREAKSVRTGHIGKISGEILSTERLDASTEEVLFTGNSMVNSYNIQDIRRMINWLKANSIVTKEEEYKIGPFDVLSKKTTKHFDTDYTTGATGASVSFNVPEGYDGRRSFVKVTGIDKDEMQELVTDICISNTSVDEESRPKTVGYDVVQNKDTIRLVIKFDEPFEDVDTLTFPSLTVRIKYWRNLT